ncbi:MAG: hypothetical protein EBX50_19870, partial [Chitinophagia bacterium]|nr:hypothetical protein [Chitinophagia bacterium]
ALNEHAFIQPPAKPKKENQNKQNMDVYYGKLNFYKQQHVEIAARNVGASAINAARAVYGPQAPSPTRELARNMGHLGLAA